MRCLSALAAGMVLALAAPTTSRAQAVDVELVLAIDSSSSVDIGEYYLQLAGYAAAFRHPDLLEAIRSGPHGGIAVALFEWSGPHKQAVNFPWRWLNDEASLSAFADELALAPRQVVGGETAVGAAIDFAIDLFADSPFVASRRVIDISGDGANNQGRSPDAARADALAEGITLNGLVILNEDPDLKSHYERHVIGGPGAFVVAARDYVDFADVILRKLIREITHVASVAAPPLIAHAD